MGNWEKRGGNLEDRCIIKWENKRAGNWDKMNGYLFSI